MKVIYAKASVERKPEFRQQTMIIQDGEKRFARKVAVGEAAKEHLKNYVRNYRQLSEILPATDQVKAVACMENEDGSVDFPFCTDPTLSELLAGKTAEEYILAVQQLKNALIETYGAQSFERTDAFTIFFNVKEDFREKSLEITNADLNFDNIFCKNTGLQNHLEYTVIDYEWILPFPIPISYLFYRAFMLDPTFSGFSKEDQNKVFSHFDIKENLIPIYQEMEAAFLNNISPEEEKLDYYARTETPMTRTQHLFDHLIRLPEDNQTLDDSNRKLNDDNRQLQKSNQQLAADLDREVRTAVELSGELEKTQKQLSEQLDKYDFYARKIWFRFFRKMGKAKSSLRKSLPGKAGFLVVFFFKKGPKATARKIKDYFHRNQAEKEFIEKEFDVKDREREEKTVFPRNICFSILVPLYNTPKEFLIEMIQSVQDQTYKKWELCLADGSDSEHAYVGEVCQQMEKEDKRIKYKKLKKNLGISGNTNACIEMASGDYIALFDHDDLLHPSALFENMKAICEQDADFIYSDEVVFLSPDKTNLIATHFKPDFAPDNLLSNNYICHFSVFKRELLDTAGWFRDECNGSQDHDIILRLTGCAKKVVHIPKVLYYWRSHPTSVASDISTKTYAIDAGRFAVKDYLSKWKNIRAEVVSTDAYPTMYHVKYPIVGHPKVAIIVDLADEDNPGNKADRAISEISIHTGYSCVEEIIIVNQSVSFEKPTRFPVSWIVTDKKERPARLNQAAQATDADYLVFLDPDLRILNSNWLEEMLMLSQQDHIGAVGARILFDDRTLRHEGLILGFGKNRLVGRSHFGIGYENTGYFGQLAIVEDVSAVSAECMIISSNKFNKVGGFPEEYRDTLFDVDFCLKLREKEFYIVYTPFAELQGGETKKYSMDYGTEYDTYIWDAKLLKQNWPKVLHETDPFYNPNLTLDYSDYRIRDK